MTRRFTISFLSAFVSCLWLNATPIAAEELPVRVAVYAQHQGGNIIYHYEVRNSGPGELREFFIGCDCPLTVADRTPQLQALPAGVQPASLKPAGLAVIDAPAQSIRQPPGWRAQIAQLAGAPGHWLAWRMPAARSNAGIMPGQTVTGFSVTLPQEDAAYLEGSYTAHVVHNGRRLQIVGQLALADTTPPTLTLQPSLGGANTETAVFRVVATAKDDRDPEPRVAVESVERLESPNSEERRYTITYSATDASGNRAMASTTVRVPAGAPTPQPAPAAPKTPGNMVQARLSLPPAGVLP